MSFIITGRIRIILVNDRFLDGNHDVVVLLVHIHRGIAFCRLFHQGVNVRTISMFGRSRHRHLGSTGADKDTHCFGNARILGGVRIGQGDHIIAFVEVREQGVGHSLAVGRPLEQHGILVGIEGSHRICPVRRAASRFGIGHLNVGGFLYVGNVDGDRSRIFVAVLVIDPYLQSVRSLGFVIEHGIGLDDASLCINGKQIRIATNSLVGVLAIHCFLVRVIKFKGANRGALGLVLGHRHSGVVNFGAFVDIPDSNLDKGFGTTETICVFNKDLYIEHCVGTILKKSFKIDILINRNHPSYRIQSKDLAIVTTCKMVRQGSVRIVRVFRISTRNNPNHCTLRRMFVNSRVGNALNRGAFITINNCNHRRLFNTLGCCARFSVVTNTDRKVIHRMGFIIDIRLYHPEIAIHDLEDPVIISFNNFIGQYRTHVFIVGLVNAEVLGALIIGTAIHDITRISVFLNCTITHKRRRLIVVVDYIDKSVSARRLDSSRLGIGNIHCKKVRRSLFVVRGKASLELTRSATS